MHYAQIVPNNEPAVSAIVNQTFSELCKKHFSHQVKGDALKHLPYTRVRQYWVCISRRGR